MDGYGLVGLIELYLATGELSLGEEASAAMSQLVKKDGSIRGKIELSELVSLFYWFSRTGEKKYENAILYQAEHMERSILAMPFYTAFDTQYGKKEHYNSVVEAFRRVTDWQGDQAVALADTIGWMSEEIFEHYKALADLLKLAVKSVMEHGSSVMNSEELQKWGYAALKGCNTGVLQNEAYWEFGIEVWKSTAGIGDHRGVGIERKFRAQYLVLGK